MSLTVIWCDWGDPDTKRLQILWEGIADLKLVHITKEWDCDMEKEVELAISSEKDTLLFCGHGTAEGLLVPGSAGEYVIHTLNAGMICAENVIGVQCWGIEFAANAGLHGFFTSMFISNIDEAETIGIYNTSGDEIEWSNRNCLTVISRLVSGELTMYECLAKLHELGYYDPVSSFNVEGVGIL